MATEDELLGIEEEEEELDDTLYIDNELRTIKIPSHIKSVGVSSDDDVVRLYFQMPRYTKEVDLAWFVIRINYKNSLGEGDVYEVDDATVDEQNDVINFSWLIGRHALEYKGQLKFNVCLKKIKPGHIVVKEFNTIIATLPILEGLETIEQVIQENADILESWKEELFGTNYAYRAALQHGFEGTEEEWLASLKGDKGDTGFYVGPIEPRTYPYAWFDTSKYAVDDDTAYINTENQDYSLADATLENVETVPSKQYDYTIV